MEEQIALREKKYRAIADKSEDYLEKARVMFEEMDLKWDLEQLEKVERKNSIT